MEDSAERERILIQTRNRVVASFILQNRNLIAPLLFFFFCNWGFLLQKTPFCWVDSKKNVSTALYNQQWTQEDKVTITQTQAAVAETSELLAISFNHYQIMDRADKVRRSR